MPYVRISIVRPLRGREDDLRSVLDRLVAYYARQAGYIEGYRLEHADDSDQFGRIGVWQSEADADRAAQTEHDIALRSELNGMIEENSHVEYVLMGTRPSNA